MITTQSQILKISECPPRILPVIVARIVPKSSRTMQEDDGNSRTFIRNGVYKAIHHPEVTSKKVNNVSSFEMRYLNESNYSDPTTKELSPFLSYASRSQNLKKVQVIFNHEVKMANFRMFGHLMAKRAMSSMLSLNLSIKRRVDKFTIKCFLLGLSRLRELRSFDIDLFSLNEWTQEQTEFGKILKNFKKLRILKVKLEPFYPDARIALAKSLSKLDELKDLKIHFGIDFMQGKIDFSQLIASLNGKKSLESLELIIDSLKNNELFNQVFNTTDTLPNLRELKFELMDFEIGHEDLLFMFQKLANLQKLETFHVHFDFCGIKVAEIYPDPLSKFVSNLKNMKDLSLNICYPQNGINIFRSIVSEPHTLISLNLKIEYLENGKYADLLFKSFTGLKSLQTLGIYFCNIVENSAKYCFNSLSDSIKQLTELKNLSLKFSLEKFHLEILQNLMSSIAVHKNLSSLKLCLSISSGAEEAFQSLTNLVELKSLKIWIYKDGKIHYIGRKFISILDSMKNLNDLNKKIGFIDDNDLKTLLKTLAKMKNLRKLNLKFEVSSENYPRILERMLKFMNDFGEKELILNIWICDDDIHYTLSKLPYEYEKRCTLLYEKGFI